MPSSSSRSRSRTAKSVISTIGSIAATAMVVRSVAREYLPPEYRQYLHHTFRTFLNKFSTHLTMVIYESEGFNDNELYTATHLYLSDRLSSDVHRLKVTKTPNEQHITVAMEINEEYTDTYNDMIKFTWSLVSKKNPTREYFTHDDNGRSTRSDLRSLELTFHYKHKDIALNEYLPYIINYAKTKKQIVRTLKIFTLEKKAYTRYPTTWTSVNLDHPATLETVAMDDDLKEMVKKDLDRFLDRRDYYRRVGKAWKRGYLLYGPPGTGKSSLIAAMANYLKFDVYDLELSDVKSNSELRRLLVATANRSVLVVEDIDCSKELRDRVRVEEEKAVAKKNQQRGYDEEAKVTLSGFLNFIDGLWSSCGDERIIIFTTNRKDKLDPALIRPGRMDVHIHMSYCTPSSFRVLASNYLSITEHNHFEEIDDLITQVEVTPAEVAEQLLKDDDPDIALGGLIEFFNEKKEIEEAKAKLKEEELDAKMNEKKQQEDKMIVKFRCLLFDS